MFSEKLKWVKTNRRPKFYRNGFWFNRFTAVVLVRTKPIPKRERNKPKRKQFRVLQKGSWVCNNSESAYGTKINKWGSRREATKTRPELHKWCLMVTERRWQSMKGRMSLLFCFKRRNGGSDFNLQANHRRKGRQNLHRRTKYPYWVGQLIALFRVKTDVQAQGELRFKLMKFASKNAIFRCLENWDFWHIFEALSQTNKTCPDFLIDSDSVASIFLDVSVYLESFHSALSMSAGL